MVVSKWIIIIPLLIGMGMNLFVKKQKLENCISPNSDIETSLVPPPYVFFIVWPILYLIIGFVYYQYALKYSIQSSFSIFMIIIFILLNVWNVIFRNYCLPLASLMYIFFITIVYYYIVYKLIKMKVKYASLMIALLLWMTFATFLTYMSYK
jgi:benzodiazapine receptor